MLISPMPPANADVSGTLRRVSTNGINREICPFLRILTAPKISSSKSYSDVLGGDCRKEPAPQNEPYTLPACTWTPANASSCSPIRAGVIAAEPAQQACAQAWGQMHTTLAAIAALRDI